MKRMLVVAVLLVALSPALAVAGSSTDAALGLGAFAVMNQILSGTGIFGGLLGAPAVAAPVVVAAPPPVVYAPPPVFVPPPRPVFVAPAPVVVAPPPVVYAPYGGYYAPKYGYARAPKYRYAPHGRYYAPVRAWCPPGHAKHGRC
jgi:hypothetical protein